MLIWAMTHIKKEKNMYKISFMVFLILWRKFMSIMPKGTQFMLIFSYETD